MASYLMDMLMIRLRKQALAAFAKAYVHWLAPPTATRTRTHAICTQQTVNHSHLRQQQQHHQLKQQQQKRVLCRSPFSCTPRRQCCYFSVAGIGHRFRCILCKHTCDSRATKILISFLQMQGSTHASRETNLWIASPQPESLVQENFDGIEPSSPAPNSILCAHGVNVLASNRCGEIKR